MGLSSLTIIYDMKRFTKISTSLLSLAALLCSVVACSGPKAIPDRDLVKIFHDAFLANAYISECNITEDSLLLYEPILERHGYTIEDMQFTVRTIASRKSSRLSDLVGEASEILEQEYKSHSYKLTVLDTIDNVAKRYYTRTIYSDSLIKVRRMSDTAKLHITITDLIPGDYNISFDYHIDTTDENYNSRAEAYLRTQDGSQAMRHTLMLTRYRDGKYTRKFTADTLHKELHVNMFYHHEKDEPKRPSITVKNFTITRIIPTEQAVDSLFEEQMGAVIFNHKFMSGGTAKRHKREKVLLESNVMSAPEPSSEEPEKERAKKSEASKSEQPTAAKAERPAPEKREQPAAQKPKAPTTVKPQTPAAAKPQPKPGERPQNSGQKLGSRAASNTPTKQTSGTKVDGSGRVKFDPTKQNSPDPRLNAKRATKSEK